MYLRRAPGSALETCCLKAGVKVVCLCACRAGDQNPSQSGAPSARIPLRLLQLLCEGLNTDLQRCMRTLSVAECADEEENAGPVQAGVDMVSVVAQYLLGLERHMNQHMLGDAAQALQTLVEFLQGPCVANQALVIRLKVPAVLTSFLSWTNRELYVRGIPRKVTVVRTELLTPPDTLLFRAKHLVRRMCRHKGTDTGAPPPTAPLKPVPSLTAPIEGHNAYAGVGVGAGAAAGGSVGTGALPAVSEPQLSEAPVELTATRAAVDPEPGTGEASDAASGASSLEEREVDNPAVSELQDGVVALLLAMLEGASDITVRQLSESLHVGVLLSKVRQFGLLIGVAASPAAPRVEVKFSCLLLLPRTPLVACRCWVFVALRRWRTFCERSSRSGAFI